MMHLEDSLDAYIEYWTVQETMLDVVSDKIDELRGCKYLGRRLKDINDRWDNVSRSLLEYTTKVVFLHRI